MRPETDAEYIDLRSIPEPNSGCILWMAAATKAGYGIGSRRNKLVYAHRLAWSVKNGPLPEGRVICHKCDNPGCVNPDHLFCGTVKDNSDDKIAKGRSNRGSRHGMSKLSERDVVEIRHAQGSLRTIANKYGVKPMAIHCIKARKTWKHVGDAA